MLRPTTNRRNIGDWMSMAYKLLHEHILHAYLMVLEPPTAAEPIVGCSWQRPQELTNSFARTHAAHKTVLAFDTDC